MLATGAVAVPSPPRSRHQRVDGRARVVFGTDGIRDLEQVAPARLMFPHARGGDFPLVVTVTTSGGLTGGDRLRLDIVVEPGGCATIVPQSAEKLYRVLPDDQPTRIETTIALGAAARCEWLAQEAILFDGSRMHRTLDIDMAPDAQVLAMEMLVLGRAAMGEAYSGGLIHDGWRIRRGGALVWADALRIEGALDRTQPYGLGDAGALATLVYAGPEAEAQLDLARGLAEPALGGATAFDGLLVIRMLGPDATRLRREVMRIAGVLRAAIFGLSPSMPAICHC
ncbi:Urease accessory protein UreD [Sphingomonas spermidinifaciens]|uniref:Urease accessory protein UreD n=1 Tax=Sphingomonas spermidinifaciens TaxID=1141889 RepID=A0A2A4B384_9SPHN|nr:urease accessory protein UreD [Sphingomonas spermidinifaciens]PCD02096.1 Urease accessory protein UreD [Sphingomonas spermidinifaciens]